MFPANSFRFEQTYPIGWRAPAQVEARFRHQRLVASQTEEEIYLLICEALARRRMASDETYAERTFKEGQEHDCG